MRNLKRTVINNNLENYDDIRVHEIYDDLNIDEQYECEQVYDEVKEYHFENEGIEKNRKISKKEMQKNYFPQYLNIE
jgi:hypothetical protein